MTNLPLTWWNGKFRRVIHATYAPRRGPVSFTNLVVRAHGGRVKLEPHTIDACKIILWSAPPAPRPPGELPGAVTIKGEWIMFECNPFGQYG